MSSPNAGPCGSDECAFTCRYVTDGGAEPCNPWKEAAGMTDTPQPATSCNLTNCNGRCGICAPAATEEVEEESDEALATAFQLAVGAWSGPEDTQALRDSFTRTRAALLSRFAALRSANARLTQEVVKLRSEVRGE